MGLIRNIVLKTAIKKALIDVTNHIEKMANYTRDVSSFSDKVKEYISYIPASSELTSDTWEGSFARMIAVRAQSEMPSSNLIQNQSEMAILISLIAEWVASKGGNVANVYREFS